MPSFSLLKFRMTRPMSVAPDSLLVIQREYAHDVLAANIKRSDDSKRQYQSTVPLEISWGHQNGEVRTVYAYVNHSEPTQNGFKLVCMGASFALNQPAQRIWTQTTVPRVAEDIAYGVRFSAYIGQHKQVWSNLTQDGKSDWDFLVALARRIGWTLRADNTDLSMHDPLDNFQRMRDNAVPLDAGLTGTVRAFKGVSGETTPDGGAKATRVVAGVDARSGEMYQASDNGDGLAYQQIGAGSFAPVFPRYETVTALNYGEAASKLAGATQVNRWHIQAKAEVAGNVRLRPGILVAIDGLSKRHDGYWYVQGVEHEVRLNDYICYLTLGRDSEWDRFERPDPRARRVIRHRNDPFGQTMSMPPPTVLINGVWRAAHGARSHVAS